LLLGLRCCFVLAGAIRTCVSCGPGSGSCCVRRGEILLADIVEIPPVASLAVVVFIFAVAFASRLFPGRQFSRPGEAGE
jgi:hypothetical protein